MKVKIHFIFINYINYLTLNLHNISVAPGHCRSFIVMPCMFYKHFLAHLEIWNIIFNKVIDHQSHVCPHSVPVTIKCTLNTDQWRYWTLKMNYPSLICPRTREYDSCAFTWICNVFVYCNHIYRYMSSTCWIAHVKSFINFLENHYYSKSKINPKNKKPKGIENISIISFSKKYKAL